MTRDEKRSIAHALLHLEVNKIADDDYPGHSGWYCGKREDFVKRHKKAITLLKLMLAEEEVNDKPNCYRCRWRSALPGDAHSRCGHPDADGIGIEKLNIAAKKTGAQRGWFFWPWNFDPVWLLNCDGFEGRKEANDEATS